ncbi:unnamed protein product [Ceratitis capitata]|uniref:(Mediterranean fruit fly) hypothetical protein n=1 Tax=Ceratitis capitata TaxID=7213 RepID=A0A811V4X4_CERCA|nr:unnamed protein product [Ceratitis capitata]
MCGVSTMRFCANSEFTLLGPVVHVTACRLVCLPRIAVQKCKLPNCNQIMPNFFLGGKKRIGKTPTSGNSMHTERLAAFGYSASTSAILFTSIRPLGSQQIFVISALV